MASYRRFVVFLLIFPVLAAGLTGFAQPTRAGFEWIPAPIRNIPDHPIFSGDRAEPEDKTTADTRPASVPDDVDSEALAPLPLLPDEPESALARAAQENEPPKMHYKKPQAQQESRTGPGLLLPQDTAPEISTRAGIKPFPKNPQQEKSNFVQAVGFGSDMPLAFALRQIVPPAYAFSFGEGVNPGYRVSWSGGKPWDVVVAEMIAPLKLSSRVQDKTVIIFNPAIKTQVKQPTANDDLIEEKANSLVVVRRQHVADPGIQPAHQPEATMQRMNGFMKAEPARNTAPQQRTQNEPAAPIALTPAQETVEEAPQQTTWEASKGQSLMETLSRWSNKAGYQLVWNATHDYTVSTPLFLSDNFTGALSVLLDQGLEGGKKPVVRLVGNTLVIENHRS